MSTPVRELPHLNFVETARSSDEENTVVEQAEVERQPARQITSSVDGHALRDRLTVATAHDSGVRFDRGRPSPSKTREEAHRLDDELAMLKVERMPTDPDRRPADGSRASVQLRRSRSRPSEPIDEFDANTNPLHEKTAVYRPPEHPSTKFATFFKYVHGSGWLVRYFTYIVPVVLILLIPLLVGRLTPKGKKANVGGVSLFWFSIWLEIVWLTLWAGRLAAKLIPWPLGLFASLFTNNSKKWRDLAKQLEIPATIFFWWLGIEISFLPTMKNHHLHGGRATKPWEATLNKIIVSVFVGATLNFAEKIIIQLIAVSFHLRTYADRIELNKFQIGSLTKLYTYSKQKIAMEDTEFEEKPSGPASGARTPAIYADKAQEAVNKAFAMVGDVAGTVAGDFTGKKITKSNHPHQVILTLLNSTAGSQVLARRLYRTFVRDGFESVFSGDLKSAFDNEDEAEAAFSMFDKDMNGDISMEELEAVCVEIGRERKSITASLKDLDSVVSKLDDVLFFVVVVVFILVLVSLLSTSATGILTSAGSAVLALSWLFSATAQEFLQSVIFVFVKHPFDVGDRVAIYGNTGSAMKGDDYFVKEIALLYTEFKKMEGHVVQAPNSYLNTLFILNMRRSGGLAEAFPVVIRFGTTLDQIEKLRLSLLDFVQNEKREFQGNILTELRDVTEAYSLTLNVVFFYKSNWQNELLRLQRRNKFICALMLAMQLHGIEGPRRNIPGWHESQPYYMQYPPGGSPPTYPDNARSDHSDRGNGSGPSVSQHDQGREAIVPSSSIMRHRTPSGGHGARGRSESISQMAKRVDFSLGMRDVSSSGQLSDFYDGRSPPVVTEAMRQSNKADDERRIEEEYIDEHGVARASGRSTSRDKSRVGMSGGLLRRSTTQSFGRGSSHGGHRDSGTSQEVHHNRFLPRFGRNNTRSMDVHRDQLIEEGQAGVMDARSGHVSSQAVRVDSSSSGPIPFPSISQTSQPQDFEMRRMGAL